MIAELLVLVPLVFALMAYLLGNKLSKWIAIIGTLINLGITKYAFFYFNEATIKPYLEINYLWLQNPKINLHLTIDGLSMVMLALTNFVSFLIVLASYKDKIENKKSFYALILFMVAALNGVFMASDGFLFYIFWELTLIPIYFIALLWGGKNRIQVTFKFFVYTLLGSLFLLVGFIYLYTIGGSLELSVLQKLKIGTSTQEWLFWLIFVAFAIKIPIFPFHTWQAETYKEAPTTGTLLLSGIMLKMGLFGLMKWLIPILPHGTKVWAPLVLVLCVIGVLYGAILAFSQKNAKRILAYASFSHVGLMAAGIFVLNTYGWQGAIVQMFAHAINVVGLFFAIEVIARRTEKYKINNLGGIRQQAPVFATFFMVVVFASISLPLTNAFVGEYLLLIGLYQYHYMLSVLSGITVILGAAYMLRLYQKTMLGEDRQITKNFQPLHWSETLFFVLVTLTIFVFGIHPQPIIDMAKQVVEEGLKLGLR